MASLQTLTTVEAISKSLAAVQAIASASADNTGGWRVTRRTALIEAAMHVRGRQPELWPKEVATLFRAALVALNSSS